MMPIWKPAKVPPPPDPDFEKAFQNSPPGAFVQMSQGSLTALQIKALEEAQRKALEEALLVGVGVMRYGPSPNPHPGPTWDYRRTIRIMAHSLNSIAAAFELLKQTQDDAEVAAGGPVRISSIVTTQAHFTDEVTIDVTFVRTIL